MFYDDPRLTKLADKVWVYKEFISQDKIDEINSIMSQYTEKDFMRESHALDFYKNKSGQYVPELIPVWNKMNEFFGPEYVSHPTLTLTPMRPGEDMFVHADSPGEGNEDMLTAPDMWSTCCILHFGAIVYFGDFTGGEVYYPNIGIEYAVKPGDLVIHSAFGHEAHGVKEVKSGIRYAYSNFVLPSEKNPGSFYNYGTQECEIRQQNPQEWIQPLFKNPLFDDEGRRVEK